VVVVEMLTNIAQVQMGAVLEGRKVDVVVHRDWERYMVVAWMPRSQ